MCGIYKIENLINGKKYIGKSIDIKKRFRSHIQESFEEKLNEKEIYWISFFDCCVLDGKDKGYNMTRGGDGSSSIDIKQLRELWDNGLSINEIANKLHCDRHAISVRLKEYEGFNDEQSKKRKNNLIANSRKREVVQYDLDGRIICQYESILDASEQTGIGYGAIRSNVQGKSYSASGFQWRYKDNPSPDKYKVKGNGYKVPIVQLDAQYNPIKSFSSIHDAALEVNISPSSLYYALNDINKMVKGFHWIYQKYLDILHESDLASH